MTAYLLVRAVVPDEADRASFDAWYRNEHLPDAIRAFGATAAMRGWSTLDPSLHTAFYRFPTTQAAESATTGEAIKVLMTEFDRCWGVKVTRTRDIVEIAQEIGLA